MIIYIYTALLWRLFNSSQVPLSSRSLKSVPSANFFIIPPSLKGIPIAKLWMFFQRLHICTWIYIYIHTAPLEAVELFSITSLLPIRKCVTIPNFWIRLPSLKGVTVVKFWIFLLWRLLNFSETRLFSLHRKASLSRIFGHSSLHWKASLSRVFGDSLCFSERRA